MNCHPIGSGNGSQCFSESNHTEDSSEERAESKSAINSRSLDSVCAVTTGLVSILCSVRTPKTVKNTAKAPASAPGNPNLAQFVQNERRSAWSFRTAPTVLAAKK